MHLKISAQGGMLFRFQCVNFEGTGKENIDISFHE